MHEFELPSGLTVELRELTGNEEEILSDERQMRDGTGLNRALRNCIVRLGDNESVSERDVQAMFTGDRQAALVRLRQITFGDELELSLVCANTKCGAENIIVVNLAEAEQKPYAPEREHSFTLPGCRQVVVFGYSTGEHELRLSKLKDDADIHSLMLMRIVSVDGNPPSRKSVRDWSANDIKHLRNKINSVDGDIDTTIKTVCRECGTPIVTRAEANYQGFFFPTDLSRKGRATTVSFLRTADSAGDIPT